MSVFVRLPFSIAHLAINKGVVECESTSVSQCIRDLESRFPGLKGILCDAEGNVSDNFFIFLNGDNITYLNGMDSMLQDGDELTIIPAAAGG